MFKKFQYSEAKSQKKKKNGHRGQGLQGVGHRQRNDFGWRCPRKRSYLRYAAG